MYCDYVESAWCTVSRLVSWSVTAATRATSCSRSSLSSTSSSHAVPPRSCAPSGPSTHTRTYRGHVQWFAVQSVYMVTLYSIEYVIDEDMVGRRLIKKVHEALMLAVCSMRSRRYHRCQLMSRRRRVPLGSNRHRLDTHSRDAT